MGVFCTTITNFFCDGRGAVTVAPATAAKDEMLLRNYFLPFPAAKFSRGRYAVASMLLPAIVGSM